VPPSLVESALFGHERGAFTGAAAAREGVFEQASGGTLLIDEIGDLDPSLQPKLLRAIERSSVQRVGASGWIKVDVRVIAATRRDLEEEIQAGRFRDDLYYRLAVARIEMPALRERTGDVRLLAAHFWEKHGGKGPIPDELVETLERYPWPGNVRELSNAVAHKVAMGELADLGALRRERGQADGRAGDVVSRAIAERLPYAAARKEVLEDFERRYLAWVLDQHGGNVSRAAEASGIARRYFYVLRGKSAKRGD
jgi:DNA-binding NtrC family response regulator